MPEESFSALSKEQIETLSEIVFGLSITFSAIQFAFSPPAYAGDLLLLVAEFSLSFTLLLWVWITYLRIARNLNRTRAPPLFLNVVLLLLVTAEPYLLYSVYVKSFVASSTGDVLKLGTQVAVGAWAVDVGLMLIVLSRIAIEAVAGRPKAESPQLGHDVHRYAWWFGLCGGALIVTALPPLFVLVYSGMAGSLPFGTISPMIYLPLLLWVPIFGALAYGSWHGSAAINRDLAHHRPSTGDTENS